MHVVHTSISKTVFNTVSDALYAPMEQTILQEPLFLLMGKLVVEPVPNLGQESLYPSGKGRDGFILSLICSIEIPHQQIKGFHIAINYCELLNNHVQWDIGSHTVDSISSGPFKNVLDSLPQG